MRNLRASVFSSILRQEVAFFDRSRTGELINRLSADTAVVGRSITDNLSDGLRAVAQAAAGVSMMVSVFTLKNTTYKKKQAKLLTMDCLRTGVQSAEFVDTSLKSFVPLFPFCLHC